MKRMLILFSCFTVCVTTYSMDDERNSLIPELKVGSPNRIQKFFSMFLCAAPEVDAPAKHYPALQDTELAPEDMYLDLLNSKEGKGYRVEIAMPSKSRISTRQGDK